MVLEGKKPEALILHSRFDACMHVCIYIFILSYFTVLQFKGGGGGLRCCSPLARGITIRDFITILCHAGFSILQVV